MEKRLRERLHRAAVLIVAAGVLLLAAEAGVAAFLARSVVEVTNEQMRAETDEYKNRLEKQMSSDYQILTTMSSFLEFSNVDEAENFDEILNEANLRNDFVSMAYFPLNGPGVLAVLGQPVRGGVELTELQPEVQEVVAQAWQGEMALSDLVQSELTQEKVFIYAIPVSRNGVTMGALIASDQVEIFSDILSGNTVLSGNGHIHLLNSRGELLIHSQNSVVEESAASIYEEPYFNGGQKAEDIRTAMAAGESVYSSFRYEGRSYQVLLEPVGIKDWYMLCVSRVQEAGERYRIVTVIAATFAVLLLMMVTLLVYGYRLTRRNDRELRELAFHDALTGGDNLRGFTLKLQEALSQRRDVNLAALDVRQFKFINEIFGRERADKLLCHIHRQLQARLEEGEFCCRDSADLFYAVLLNADPAQAAARLRNIMDEACAAALHDANSDYHILLYAGMVAAPQCAASGKVDDVLTHAMFALERAKGASSNTVWTYDTELHKKEEVANYVESHMHQALQSGEFRMYLQPKIDLTSGRLGGAEALVRWTTGTGRILYPDQFIPLFEQNGFSVSLDLYMVECACKQLRAWLDQGIQPPPLSVNQSKLLFFEADYIQKLERLTERYQIPASWITLEILEGLALENAGELNARISQLQGIGFRISMDDFGSGYSSLNTLSSLQIDELKLDRGFLMEAADKNDPRSRVIMEQVVQMAKQLGISVVVEGVETQENEALIRSLGCDFGQGYYYSRPITVEEFTARYWGVPEDAPQEAAP
ncbi:MAG TPA: EAL domain-containing protein [Candidatus Fournierella excrementigallinarum]|nr:EAL domain-containing protein [Candidatus Fournierella excrementigallinarum]